MKKELPAPSLFELMIFRMSRTSIKTVLNDSWRDYNFYRQKGWFESDYYYATRLNIFKKITGIALDRIFTGIYSKKVPPQQIQPV